MLAICARRQVPVLTYSVARFAARPIYLKASSRLALRARQLHSGWTTTPAVVCSQAAVGLRSAAANSGRRLAPIRAFARRNSGKAGKDGAKSEGAPPAARSTLCTPVVVIIRQQLSLSLLLACSRR